MTENSEYHREHVIIPSVSGPVLNNGPLVAFYTVWKPEGNNSYRAVLQGSLERLFNTMEEAHSAALIEAKAKLDEVLDSQ